MFGIPSGIQGRVNRFNVSDYDVQPDVKGVP